MATYIEAGGRRFRVGGSIDLILERYTDGERYICDLKTGSRRPRGVWPQLAAYAFACGGGEQSYLCEGVTKCAVLWIPRQRYRLNDAQPEWEERPMSEMYRAGKTMACFAALAMTLPAPTIPSQRACSSCTVEDCVVRWW